MAVEQPIWAQRIRALREAKGMSQAQAVDAMRRHADRELPESEHMLRRWKAWESGDNKPGREYAVLVAATLGTVTNALFPPETHATDSSLLIATGMDTLEIIGRLRQSDVNDATLEAIRITVDKLCSEYAYAIPGNLIIESRQWLRRIVELQDSHMTFGQRKQTLEFAGWLTLLVGCLEYDLGDHRSAEATRRMALSLGSEIDNPGLLGWAYEMQAWFALTSGDYRGVVAAAETGQEAARNHSSRVQLIAQEAKALARMGRMPEMETALERGRVILDSMPYPDNIQNHFVVDPAKFDFYAMDCYRQVGNDRLARTLAEGVIRLGTDFNGTERTPMRIAEARITLGVAAAREGDLEEAVFRGRQALSGDRKSLPSLLMVSTDLATELANRYAGEPEADEYRAELLAIAHAK